MEIDVENTICPKLLLLQSYTVNSFECNEAMLSKSFEDFTNNCKIEKSFITCCSVYFIFFLDILKTKTEDKSNTKQALSFHSFLSPWKSERKGKFILYFK